MKHTPGPWKLYQAQEHSTLEVQDGCGTHSKNAVVHWAGFDSSDKPQAEKLANARLITAAPDLLEAAKTLAAWDQSTDDTALLSIACSKARVAIAKATARR